MNKVNPLDDPELEAAAQILCALGPGARSLADYRSDVSACPQAAKLIIAVAREQIAILDAAQAKDFARKNAEAAAAMKRSALEKGALEVRAVLGNKK